MNENIQHMFVIATGYAIKYERKQGFEHSIIGKWCFYHGDEYLTNVNVKEFSKYHLKGYSFTFIEKLQFLAFDVSSNDYN